jgi:hypothetical protein
MTPSATEARQELRGVSDSVLLQTGVNRSLMYQKSAGGFVVNLHLTFAAAVGHILYDMPQENTTNKLERPL